MSATLQAPGWQAPPGASLRAPIPRDAILLATTPGAEASPPARALGAWLPQGQAADPARSAEALESHLRSQPGACAVVLIESPVSAVRRALSASPDRDPESVLSEWCSVAQRLLRIVTAQPTRCLCADVDEVAVPGSAWKEALGRWIGAPAPDLDAPGATDTAAASALDQLLAQALASRHASATPMRLYEQLLACCIALDTVGGPAERPEPAAALAEVRALRAQQARSGTSENEARQEAREALDRLFATQEELEQLLNELAASRAETARCQVQLQEVERARARDAVESDTRLQALSSELDAARDETSSLKASTASEAAAAKREADDLLEKLHDAHEQLSRYYLEWRALQSMSPLLAHGRGPSLRATGVHIAGEHADGQHRHIDLQLRDVALHGRRYPDCRVRLVEHRGRPGIVLFSTPPAGPMLARWQPAGSEAGADFMLMVPTDVAGRDALQRMGRSDWCTIADVAGLMLRGLTEARSDRWAGVARRLCRQLAAMPTRLRYDRLEVVDASDHGPLRAVFGGVMFGPLEFDTLAVEWSASSANPAPELLAPVGTDPCALVEWPVSDGGEPAARWSMPVGAGCARTDKRRRWANLAPVDRDLLLALLDALPAVQEKAPSPGTSSFAAAARAWLSEAHGLNRSLTWRRLLRRLLRR